MGTKHDVLTEEELASYRVNPAVCAVIKRLLSETDPPLPRERINILDWGCGRGRSVAKLHEDGFNAYGVDIDDSSMRNAYPLFEARGLDPCALLRKVNDTPQFQDSFFHCIFSEQVFEHIGDLRAVLAEMSRLIKPGGVGIHCFPGSRTIVEEHLHMPLVHWLPKNATRRLTIALLTALGYGPKTEWPESHGRGYWFKVETYYQYLNRKTCYRDTEEICKTAKDTGFSPHYQVTGSDYPCKRWLPLSLLRNGFPQASVTLLLTRMKDTFPKLPNKPA